MLPHKGVLELLVAFTVNGPQPVVLSKSKAAVGVGLTQMVFSIKSVPQLFEVISLTV